MDSHNRPRRARGVFPLDWDGGSKEDQFRGFISAKAFALVHVVVGMMLTLFFSVFVTLILRKVVLRQ